MADFDYDLFTIGAGSGGVRASRIAASHGAKVAVAEEYRVGGTCVIRGCVPKKMLVYAAHFAEDLHDAASFGWDVDGAKFNWQRLRDLVMGDVDRLNGLYTQTLNNNEVTIYQQRAVISGPNEVTLADGTRITAKHILVAVGARPLVPEIEGAELGITSNEAFHLDALPKRILIAGGGYIANEFAGIFNAFGSEVSIINRSDQILRSYDEELRERLVAVSKQQGINFLFNAQCTKIEKQGDGSLLATITGQDPLEVDQVMFAIGRMPNIEGLGLEDAGIKTGKNGAIVVDEYNQTSVPSIYAVGDVTDRVQLTPVAIREGQAVADSLFGGKPTTISYDAIASAVFSHPPIAAVGLTEVEARAKYGEDVSVYTSDFRPMKNVVASRDERGFYKMLCTGADEKIVGLHLLGPESAEVLQGAAVAVKAGLTKADFDATMAIHPSMAEELVLLK